LLVVEGDTNIQTLQKQVDMVEEEHQLDPAQILVLKEQTSPEVVEVEQVKDRLVVDKAVLVLS
jgi:hypothetical protein